MATIYRGRDFETDELVAIKRFDKDTHLPEIQAEAFRRDVEALTDLKHPHIVQIRDHGEDERGKPFLVLEWMSHDLVGHKRRGSPAFLKWDNFSQDVALPLLKALAHTHARGWSHRDVKPANVLVADDGTVKLSDFSVSKLKRHLRPLATLNEVVEPSPPFSPKEPNDGSYEFARDVFGFGALCVWAMSSAPIDDYKALDRALNSGIFEDTVRELLLRCLRDNPEERPLTAGVLEQEFTRIHQLQWSDRVRRERTQAKCRTTIHQIARKKIAEMIGNEDIDAIDRFCQIDLNDEAHIRRAISGFGTPNERVNPDEYEVIGLRFVYPIVRNLQNANQIVVRDVFAKSTNEIATLKLDSSPSPIRFAISSEPGGITADKAFAIIGSVLDQFESQHVKMSDRTELTGILSAWNRILDASQQIKENRFAPIDFVDAMTQGRQATLTLAVPGSAAGVPRKEAIEIRNKDRRYSGTVEEISNKSITLSFPERTVLSGFPVKGRAVPDIGLAKFAIDRQKDAVQAISAGTNERPDLKDLILKPDTSRKPITSGVQLLCTSSQDNDEALDSAQDDVIRAAITAQDILLIHGPPGTGKTTFIVATIRELFARNPQARILLTSKNHVAIDHALEELADKAKELRLLRMGRPDDPKIAESSIPLLTSEQLKRWGEEVARGTEAFLAEWANSQGIDADEILTGVLLKQIVHERLRVPELRHQIQQIEEEIAKLTGQMESGERSAASIETDIQLLQQESDDLRRKLHSAKDVTDKLEQDFCRRRPDSDSFLKLSNNELDEWYEVLVGESPIKKRAAQIVQLQAKWLESFRDNEHFQVALFERSHVVAATCIGFAGQRGVALNTSYDLCIIDEASTAAATEALVPMQAAKRWILVGDEKQLGVYDELGLTSDELESEFDIPPEANLSLFEILKARLPSHCQRMLNVQYRMVPPIGNLISECFYKEDGGIKSHERALDPVLISVLGKSVVWLSTSKRADRRESKDSLFINMAEVQIVLDTLEKFDKTIKRQAPERVATILLLSAYNQQVRFLENQIRTRIAEFQHLSIECSTVDSIQGQEADVVFFSVTRSNPDHKAGFLKELARTNVALSRAREQLVIVGDDEFVRRAPNAEPLRRVFRHIEAFPNECAIKILGTNRTM
jgi:serine/threonine protein kinase/DNA polymerase III delta prime subunit